MFGRRGIWVDGWKAVTTHREGQPFSDKEWELYNLETDFSECNNLASEHPERLKEMVELWWAEAGRHGVLPLDDRTVALFGTHVRPGSIHETGEYTYYPPIDHLASNVAPAFGNRSFEIRADIIAGGESEGIIAAFGSQNAGFAWYVKDGKMVFDYNAFTEHHVLRSDQRIPEGKHSITAKFLKEGNKGTIGLFLDSIACGSLDVPFVMRIITSTGMDIGINSLSPIAADYEKPFPFSGVIKKVDIKVLSPAMSEEEGRNWFRVEMARQ
jgi:arylsulfatase